jgi:hypothetical protein
MRTRGGVGGGPAPPFLTSALHWGEWWDPRPSRFTSEERASGTLWLGDWEGLKTDLDAMQKIQITCLCRESNPCRSARSSSLYWLSYRGPIKIKALFRSVTIEGWLVNRFIGHLYIPLRTRSNYIAIVSLYTLQITTAHVKHFSSLLCFHRPVSWQRLLIVEILKFHAVRFYLHSLQCRNQPSTDNWHISNSNCQAGGHFTPTSWTSLHRVFFN